MIVYEVDAVDLLVMEEARKQLHELIEWPSLDNIPLLILGNKSDIDGALTEEELIEESRIDR